MVPQVSSMSRTSTIHSPSTALTDGSRQLTLSKATCFANVFAVTVSSIVVSGFIAPNWYVKVSPFNRSLAKCPNNNPYVTHILSAPDT
jgi:hypothetical protein